jgi:hypothetical protein
MFFNDKLFTYKHYKRLSTQARWIYFSKIFASLLAVGIALSFGWSVYNSSPLFNKGFKYTVNRVLPKLSKKQSVLGTLKKKDVEPLGSVVPHKDIMAIFQLDDTNTPQRAYMINTSQRLFETTPAIATAQHIPKLLGPSMESVNLLLKHYESLSALLSTQSLQVSVLHVDEENRFDVVLSNGIKLIFGQFEPSKQLQQLLHVNASILHTPQKVTLLDLRYPNGIAITLHDTAA